MVTPLMTNWMPMTAVIRPMIFETIRCPVGPIHATIDGAARRIRNVNRMLTASAPPSASRRVPSWACPTRTITVVIAPGPAMTGMPSGTIEGSTLSPAGASFSPF